MAPPGSVPLELVKTLRQRSGKSMKECKEALVATGCDLEAAVRWIEGGTTNSAGAGSGVTAPASSPPAQLPGIFASMAVVGDGAGASADLATSSPMHSLPDTSGMSPSPSLALSTGLFGGLEIASAEPVAAAKEEVRPHVPGSARAAVGTVQPTARMGWVGLGEGHA